MALPAQPGGISASVGLLVVRRGDLDDAPRQHAAQDVRAHRRVHAHPLEFVRVKLGWLSEQGEIHADLANIVKQGANPDVSSASKPKPISRPISTAYSAERRQWP